jgi:hypothetical protein
MQEYLANYFVQRTELVFEINTSWKLVLDGGNRLCVPQLRLFH